MRERARKIYIYIIIPDSLDSFVERWVSTLTVYKNKKINRINVSEKKQAFWRPTKQRSNNKTPLIFHI